MKQKLFNVAAILSLIISVFFVATRPTVAADTSVPYGDEIKFVGDDGCDRVTMGMEETGLGGVFDEFYIKLWQDGNTEQGDCGDLINTQSLIWSYDEEAAVPFEGGGISYRKYGWTAGESQRVTLGAFKISAALQPYVWNESEDNYYMRDTNGVVSIEGEKQWDNVTIYDSVNWSTEDVNSWTTEVPNDATGIFIRVYGQNTTTSAALAFSGDAGETKQIAGIVRDNEHTYKDNDLSFWVPLNNGEFYYRAITEDFSYVSLIVYGYTYE